MSVDRIDGNNRVNPYDRWEASSSEDMNIRKKQFVPNSIMTSSPFQQSLTAFHVDIGGLLNGSQQNTTGGVQV